MLFALDWIWNALETIRLEVVRLVEGTTFTSISVAMTGFWPVLVFCALMSAWLWGYGFQKHKMISAIIGALLMGSIGWRIGMISNEAYLSTSIVYALLLGMAGYVAFYILYHISLLVGGFLFFYAACGMLPKLTPYAVWIALGLTIVYIILFVVFKLVMSVVTGSVLLGMMFYLISPIVAVMVTIVLIASGTPLQFYLRRRYRDRLNREYQEQLTKYPYGPGLVYGWPEPERTGADRIRTKKAK